MPEYVITDQELLERLKGGDDKAFHAIYKRYGQRCFRLALQKIKNQEVAEEIVQNIFISLWERRSTLSVQNIEAYLMVSVKYQVINFIESKLTREKFALTLPPQYESENPVENAIFFQDLTAALEKALNELPQKTQEVYRLSRFENLSGREISEHTGLSEKSVEYHISQSLKFLRLQLKDFIGICVLFNLINSC